MRNLELKVRVAGLEPYRQAAESIGARPVAVLRDTDVYFDAARGRLKLRRTEGSPAATLIAYRRPDRSGSRYSDYRLVPVPNPEPLADALTLAVGVLATVVKEREVFEHGHTRIHLDRVEGLGTFVELETVLRGQSAAEAEAEHAFVRDNLCLNHLESVAGSYLDLTLAHRGPE